MAPSSPDPLSRSDYAPSSLPSTGARMLAFGSILLGGLCGGLIGYAFVELSGGGPLAAGLAGLAGAVVGAVGVGIVAVLALRATAEWRRVEHRDTAP